MDTTIFSISEDGDTLLPLKSQPYESEDVLQKLLADFPHLLAGGDGADGRTWLLVRREAAVAENPEGRSRWSLDHLFVDPEAVPVMVEVKRSSDPRARRGVVAQLLEYAANAAHWPEGWIRDAFERRVTEERQDPERVLADFLGEEADPEAFWEQVQANLTAGRIRLVFVADAIPQELRTIIEFLNSQMKAEVHAVEVQQFVGENGQRTLVPRIIGRTTAAQAVRRAVGGSWDEETFYAELGERRGPGEVEVARRIQEWAKARLPVIEWGVGKSLGSLSFAVAVDDIKHKPFVLYTDGKIGIQFGLMRTPFDTSEKREELRRRLNAIPRVEIPVDGVNRWPPIEMAALAASPSALKQFLDIMDWYCDEIGAPR